jgi:hypothetical protein
MIVKEFEVAITDLEDLTAQPSCDRGRGQQIITSDAILIANEFDSNHCFIPATIVR